MIAFLYGRAFGIFVEPVARTLRDAVVAAGSDAIVMTIEALRQRDPRAVIVDQVYVLPFDAPAGTEPAALVAELLPKATIVNSFGAHDLCVDKIATQERLLGRGLPMPDTIITSDARDVYEFVYEHQFALLKEPRSCGGEGHLVVWIEDGEIYGDSGSHRYKLQLVPQGDRLVLGETMTYPPPYYVQRMVGGGGRKVEPPQVLRAYVIDRQIKFWTERYRETYARPSDWIVNVGRGARYRFFADASDDAKKITLRAADILGIRFGVVDLVRTATDGPYIIEADTDGHRMFIDRSFRGLPEYRDIYDFDGAVAQALVADEEAAMEAALAKSTPKPPPVKPPLRLRRQESGPGRPRPDRDREPPRGFPRSNRPKPR